MDFAVTNSESEPPTYPAATSAPMPNPIPRVSVIIPAYNTANLIGDCLNSVFTQTYKDFEVLVVNDGSPDTPELEKALTPFVRKIIYIKQQNKRAAGARNNAIGRARGQFVAFLDSDDVWLPNHLASQMALLDSDPSLDMVYANALLAGEPSNSQEFMQKCPSQGSATFESLIVEKCQIPVSTVVARKSSLVKACLFDETLPRCDDYDMWVRTAFHGAKIAYGREVQAKLNDGRPGSLGVSRFKMAEACFNILEKLSSTLSLTPDQKQIVGDRAAEMKAQSQYEQAKCELAEHHFAEAIELFSKANQRMRSAKVSAVLLALKLAPKPTTQLIGYWSRMRNRA